MFLSEHERYAKCEPGNMAGQEKLPKKGGGRLVHPVCDGSGRHAAGRGRAHFTGKRGIAAPYAGRRSSACRSHGPQPRHGGGAAAAAGPAHARCADDGYDDLRCCAHALPFRHAAGAGNGRRRVRGAGAHGPGGACLQRQRRPFVCVLQGIRLRF